MIRIPLGNERSSRVEVRSVAPDSNPYMVMLSVFKTGLEGETARIKNLRQAERYLPDNIYDAIANFRAAEWTTKLIGEDVPVEIVTHSQLKEMSAKVKAVIRTGDFTAYANVILVSGAGPRWFCEK